MNRSALRSLPSVDRILRNLPDISLPRPLIVSIVRRELDALRKEHSRKSAPKTSSDQLISRIRTALDDLQSQRIRPLINATGILVHTNFGRSPLHQDAIVAMSEIAANYNNLEFDLTGRNRRSRAGYVDLALAVLYDTPPATIRKNCPAALVLLLPQFAPSSPDHTDTT